MTIPHCVFFFVFRLIKTAQGCFFNMLCYNLDMEKNLKTYKRSAQDIQDEFFRKISADRKIDIASKLTMFCLELNHLNGDNRSKKSDIKNNPYF